MPSDGDWSEYARQVLAELKRHDIWLNKLDTSINNHVNHIEHRLTQMETTLKNMKWMIGFLLTAVLGMFGMVLVILLS